MPPIKTLHVLGDAQDIFVDSTMSGGALTVIVSTTRPGSGPPPHMHSREDETFCVLEGSYEFWSEGVWSPIPLNTPVFAPRNVPHTFRNAGTTPGRLLTAITPSGIEGFFEQISGLTPANDMPRILELYDQYGLSVVKTP